MNYNVMVVFNHGTLFSTIDTYVVDYDATFLVSRELITNDLN